jgi:hypothetical protein
MLVREPKGATLVAAKNLRHRDVAGQRLMVKKLEYDGVAVGRSAGVSVR